MIILKHNKKIVTSILDEGFFPITSYSIGLSITVTLKNIMIFQPDELIIWCYEELFENLNINDFSNIFHHNRVLAFYNPFDNEYLPNQIGYIERSFYLKINKNVTFPTWVTSSFVGGINTTILYRLKEQLDYNQSFDYFLLSLAKQGMIQGLFCYSEPKLLKGNINLKTEVPKASKQELFKFVKHHYKWVWVVFLAWSYIIYERELSIFYLIKSFFYKRLNSDFDLESIKIQSSRKLINDKTIDVIIPTIGRKKYLYNVLLDLSKQTHLPINVIIVEQNPELNSNSELDYLNSENWPFNIKHVFTHQLGVCNARNIALSFVESEWTFLGDDDNRFKNSLLETIFNKIEKLGAKVLTTVYIQPHEEQQFFKTAQTSIFGSGNSFVKSDLLKYVKFNTSFEFNYGEDSDFGMQLRRSGADVIYLADTVITHLKAPVGGYRIKFKQLWDEDKVQPKPSPTIQLLNQTYFTKQQIEGYKLLLFLKQFLAFGYKNPIKYKILFTEQWKQSVFWSNKLKQKTNA